MPEQDVGPILIGPGQTANGIKNENEYPVFVYSWKPFPIVYKDSDAETQTE